MAFFRAMSSAKGPSRPGRLAILPIRRCFFVVLSLVVLVLPSCTWDGNFTVLGYTTRPNYDTSIHTIRVPIFKNLTFRRELEFDLTKAVVREIEAKTPFKVVGEGCPADTELTGTIVTVPKTLLNRTQLNEVREAETLLGVQVVWRDLRTGEILSREKPPPGAPPPPPPPPGAAPPTVLVQSLGHFIPELGQTLTTAEKENIDRLAIQIVSMMEAPW